MMALLLTVMTVSAQTTVTTHWTLDKSIKDLTPGTTAYNTATAATISCEGTDVAKLLETSAAFGAKLAFQATITPQSYVTKQTGLQMLRFKTQGAADGTDDYGMTLTLKPTSGELTYVPTKVSLSVASWLQNSNTAFEVILRKLNADGEVTQTYTLGQVKSHSDVNAQYDDVAFDVPATATASSRLDFPLPDTPVTTVITLSGICTFMPRRLFIRACRMSMWRFHGRREVGMARVSWPVR